MMRYSYFFFSCIFLLFFSIPSSAGIEKTRVIVTTDGEADDRASMVRFLLSSNEFDVEGIINSSSQFHWVGGKGWNAFHEVSWIKEYIERYAEVYPNLLIHNPNYPSPELLLSKWKVGNINGISEDSIRTEGAEWIVKVLLDSTDTRPVWIQAWGGCNTISRALRIIEEDYPSRMSELASKLRLFLIWEQDETYQSYIRPNWEKFNIPTIISDQFDCMAYIWPKVLPAQIRSYFEKDWMTENILNDHGPLCDLYENNQGDFNAEGDTPAFLHSISNGLRSNESPDYGGWAGRYVRVRHNVWMDPLPDSTFHRPLEQWGFQNSWSKKLEHATDSASVQIRTNYFKPIWRWLDDVQNDFAVRADWCVKDYKSANHHPIIRLKNTPLNIWAEAGQKISLDASPSTDPDNDRLNFHWWQYQEAGTYKGEVKIVSSQTIVNPSNSFDCSTQSKIKIKIPKDAKVGDTIHMICELSDDGTPKLTQYQRVIITIVSPISGIEKESQNPKQNLEFFSLNEVELNNDMHEHPSQFVQNRDKFLNELALTNPDDFLYMFRNAFGQPQPAGAKALGVWDSQEIKLRGHTTGHYLSALAQAYAGELASPNERASLFLTKMEHVVDELYRLSKLSGTSLSGLNISKPNLVPPVDAETGYNSDLSEKGMRTDYWNWGEGYISAYPPDQFIMLEKGAKYGAKDDNVWAPYYTLHKILAGLLDVYEITGNEKALQTLTGMSDWVHARLSVLPDSTLNAMWGLYIAGEFGGINEVLARVSSITKNPKYVQTALYFDNTRVFFGDKNHSGGLAKNVDLFRGLHANQHIPQMLGALEIYRNTNHKKYYDVADNFWKMVRSNYMYSIGGVAGASTPDNPECFPAEPSSLYKYGFSKAGQNETCASYNLLKLSSNLFLYDQRTELMDYYERTLYNHILASVDEHSPANTYHVPLNPGSVKNFSNPHMDGFTCCNGTAMESNTKFQQAIYFKEEEKKRVFVNLFIPSTLHWKEKGIEIVQKTAYPEDDNTCFIVNTDAEFELQIRIPAWAKKDVQMTINQKKWKGECVPGSYVKIKRKWKKGDELKLKIPFHFYVEPVMDNPKLMSLFYGPVLLAAQEDGSLEDWRKIKLDRSNLNKSIQPIEKESLHFWVDGVLFKPFYKTYGHHSVYFIAE